MWDHLQHDANADVQSREHTTSHSTIRSPRPYLIQIHCGLQVHSSSGTGFGVPFALKASSKAKCSVSRAAGSSLPTPYVVGPRGDRIPLDKHRSHYTFRCTPCNDNIGSSKGHWKRVQEPGALMPT